MKFGLKIAALGRRGHRCCSGSGRLEFHGHHHERPSREPWPRRRRCRWRRHQRHLLAADRVERYLGHDRSFGHRGSAEQSDVHADGRPAIRANLAGYAVPQHALRHAPGFANDTKFTIHRSYSPPNGAPTINIDPQDSATSLSTDAAGWIAPFFPASSGPTDFAQLVLDQSAVAAGGDVAVDIEFFGAGQSLGTITGTFFGTAVARFLSPARWPCSASVWSAARSCVADARPPS